MLDKTVLDKTNSDEIKPLNATPCVEVNDLLYPHELATHWNLDDINQFLVWCNSHHASDVSISSGQPIWAKIYNDWRIVTKRPLIHNEVETLLLEMYRSNAASARLKGAQDIDFAYEFKFDRFSRIRFRCNATAIQAGMGSGMDITLRSIPSIPPLLEDMNPEQVIMDKAFPLSGLVLVTGVMGTGKSTLLSGILRHIIENHRRRIITYEAPIEFDLMSFDAPKSICLQTEVPSQLTGFNVAPRNSARRAADVILVGEARDPETIQGMIEAAEIGVAAYATVHTRSVAETIPRIINTFPPEMRQQIAVTLISSARLIIQQRLVEKKGGGRIAIREILHFDSSIRDELVKAPIHELIPRIQQYVVDKGQSLIDDARNKFQNDLITRDEFNRLRNEFL